jgi:hypothetical protein
LSPHSPPEDLYANGLNRHLFLPFVDVLTTFCRTHDMGSDNDFRLETTGREGVFFDASEDGQDTDALLEDAFAALVAGENEKAGQQEAQIVPTMFGRSISVARSHGRVCWLEFDQLCREDRGASDYAAICARFDTVLLRGVPRMSVQQHDEARRFITLVDQLYENQVRLVYSAEAHPMDLFEGRTTSTINRAASTQAVGYADESGRSTGGPEESPPVHDPLGYARGQDLLGYRRPVSDPTDEDGKDDEDGNGADGGEFGGRPGITLSSSAGKAAKNIDSSDSSGSSGIDGSDGSDGDASYAASDADGFGKPLGRPGAPFCPATGTEDTEDTEATIRAREQVIIPDSVDLAASEMSSVQVRHMLLAFITRVCDGRIVYIMRRLRVRSFVV